MVRRFLVWTNGKLGLLLGSSCGLAAMVEDLKITGKTESIISFTFSNYILLPQFATSESGLVLHRETIMDFWVVAAATGAGYVAKHLQSLSGDKDGSSNQSPMPSPRLQPQPCRAFSKIPNSVFPPPASGLAPAYIEKQILQDDPDEINEKHDYFDTSGHHLQEFRTNNTNAKSFSTLRPLVATSNGRDSGRKKMTKLDDTKDRKIVFMNEIGASVEAALLEADGSVKLPRRPKQMHVKRFATGNDMVPLFIGITIGILSTIVNNQHEVDHLNELLEEAESMARDLHNKLETKDRITRKEHGTEAIETATNSPKADNFELTSDIEAELEAELVRLEQNMTNVMEVDSDIEADMAEGDLNLDSLTWQLDSRSESDHGDNNESTSRPVFTPNYAVSPLDLRLRLHELIESELRARIEELEAVLENQNSQSKPRSPQSQEENSFWDFDHTRIESSSSTP
ncbi:hypothetical protein OSB04_018321 [Centaurea solstitialis]|uniref:Uncharacterized protein n=1 Tax=Centaurea solstitialis TaxID=347529 RepID=A0AA38TFI3_9ASTR|nr:hypothetical protein OSB04_018321 [Centaurea solstitialis]